MPFPVPPRGTTLIESMVAMAVLIIGAAGVAGLHSQAVRVEGDSRHITRATALAQDLLNQMELWPYGDPRLSNDDPANDATYGDAHSYTAMTATDPVAAGGADGADHGEADLVKGGAAWNGLPDPSGQGYQRFWNVSYSDDSNGNGTPDAVRIAAVVRWRSGASWRRVVLHLTKPNPAEAP